ncbi:MAG: MaoC/PaaZ C-terminal domain-containing protein [Dehalococcoidia bacterium]
MYFEEFSQGDRFTTRSRVVTGTDMDIFAALTGATNPLFLNEEFGKKQGFKGRIAPGMLILALAVGAQYSMGLFDHIIAFLGIDKLRFLSPVYPGDTIKYNVELIEKRETERQERGIIVFRWVGQNQDGKSVLEAEGTFMMRKREVGHV